MGDVYLSSLEGIEGREALGPFVGRPICKYEVVCTQCSPLHQGDELRSARRIFFWDCAFTNVEMREQ